MEILLTANKNYDENLFDYIPHFILLKHILIIRKYAKEKIMKAYLRHLNKKKQLIQIIKNKIRYDLKNSLNKIITSYLNYSFRINAKKIIEKEKSHFKILCMIKSAKIVQIKVYSHSDKDNKILNFDFCSIQQCFVLYIKKSTVSLSTFKVNFIADGKIVIDPMYRAHYDEKGNFFNIIDFKKINELENERKQD